MAVALEELAAPDRAALVLQEVQNGVVGEPSVLPALAAAAASTDLVGRCARLAAAARGAGVPVVHCLAETRPDGRGANRNARLFAAVRRAPVQLTPGTAAVAVPEAVGVAPEDLVLRRHHGLGPVTGTELDPTLRHLGVTTVVAVGVSLNVGILDLAFGAVNLGYRVVVPADAVAGVPVDYGRAVLEHTLAVVATLTTTDAVARVWERCSGRAGG